MTGQGSGRILLPCTQRRIAAGEPVRVVLYGDSISEVGRTPDWNGGATAPERNWGAQLVDRLAWHYPGSEFRAVHFGIGGQNSYEGLGRLDGLAELAPDLVLVAFGANDCCHHDLLPEQTRLALTALVEGIRVRYEADTVLVGTGGDNPLKPFLGHLDETLDAQRKAAADAGVPYVDVRAAVLAATEHGKRWAALHLGDDNCHPTDAGHAVWAETVLAAICRALP